MRRLLFLVFAVMLSAAVVLMFGCSDSTSSKKETGDPNDPEFGIVSEIAGEGNFMFNMLLLDFSTELLDSIPDAIGKPGAGKFAVATDDIDSILIASYVYSNYWHIFSFSVYVAEDETEFAFTGIDSLRLSDAEGYVQYDIETVTKMEIRAHFDIDFYDDEIEGEMAQHAAFTLTAVGEDYTIDGSSYDSLLISGLVGEGSCAIGMNFEQDVDNVLIDYMVEEYGYCPLQGEIDLNLGVDFECEAPADTLNFSGDWWINFVFDNGNINAIYENETTRWVYSGQCRGDVTAKPGWSSVFD